MKHQKALLCLMLVTMGCAVFRPPPVWHKTVPEDDWSLLEGRLLEAGSNRIELEKAFALTPASLHPQVALLISRMPTVDLAACSGELLARTVILTDSMRRALRYGGSIPQKIFLDYVLPLRVSQEPLEDFRPFFVEELYPIVRDCTSVEGAAVAVNRWCGSKVKFKQTQRRDQGPFETLKSGYGRCEELMIFFSDACRSVCIPAREAWTPWWTYQDNNHAWTEIWTPQGWKYTGAAEPRDHLNEAWFSDPVKRAALVLAAKQGPPLPGEKLYKSGGRYSLINVTKNYTAAATLTIQLFDGWKAIADSTVFVNVFNFGALRPIGKIQTDSTGTAEISLGKGDYAITTESEQPILTIVQHRPPQASKIMIDISKPHPVPESFWLRYDP